MRIITILLIGLALVLLLNACSPGVEEFEPQKTSVEESKQADELPDAAEDIEVLSDDEIDIGEVY